MLLGARGDPGLRPDMESTRGRWWMVVSALGVSAGASFRPPPPSYDEALHDQRQRDPQIVHELLRWPEPHDGVFLATALPQWQRDLVATMLPKGGLFDVLERRSDAFDCDRNRGIWRRRERAVGVSEAASSGGAQTWNGQHAFLQLPAAEGAQTPASHQLAPITHAAPRTAEDGVRMPAAQQPITATPGALRTAPEGVQPPAQDQLAQALVMDL